MMRRARGEWRVGEVQMPCLTAEPYRGFRAESNLGTEYL